MRSRIHVTALLVVLLVAACSSDAEETTTSVEVDTTASVAETTTTTVAETTTTIAETTTTVAETTTTVAETTTTTSPPETTTTTTALAVEINNQGIQAGDEWVYFGYDDEDAIAAVSTVLGAPDTDSGWVDSFSVYGTCPGSVVRGVHWGSLTLLFTQADTDFWSGGVPHFFAYYYTNTPPDLMTSEGLSLGMTLADLEAIYGGSDLVTGEADLVPGETFWSYKQASWTGLWGYAGGLDPTAPVSSINGGRGCGE